MQYKQGKYQMTSAVIMEEVVQKKFREALRGMSDQDILNLGS